MSLGNEYSNHENFSAKSQMKNSHAPLAERMRPNELDDYVGQSHLIGPNTLLCNLLKNEEIPNMILWGPPGCGKTSLVNVIMKQSKTFSKYPVKFIKFAATTAGINDVKKIILDAESYLKKGGKTVVFMDEIHRFNKLQQDVFLPHVEEGTFILIGATTENPSSNLNSALLSRCRVFVLNKLTKNDLLPLLSKAVEKLGGKVILKKNKYEQFGSIRFLIHKDILDWLSEVCDGDARVALGGLDTTVSLKVPKNVEVNAKLITINSNDIKKSLEKIQNFNGKQTDQMNYLHNALHHSIKDNQEMPALYWLARLIQDGEDPVNIARRLVRIAGEDIGLCDEEALSMALNTVRACQLIGLPESDVILAQCVVYLTRAKKSEEIEGAFFKCQNKIENHVGPQPKVPLFIKDTSGQGKLRSALGKSYQEIKTLENLNKNHLPQGLEDVDFFV
ncbi:hypothetical protein TKK_0004875 [Trichogramma kaykai]|uniref:AAA+ ATPase domain-containing protein n=1 Tax=Trichogramma kaykai TaxID=54128 RepID=A0ABD2XJQ6_9HYME